MRYKKSLAFHIMPRIVLLIIRWIFAVLALLAGIVYVSDSFIGGVLIILASLLFIPYITKFIQKRLSKYNTKLITVLIYVIGFVLFVSGAYIWSDSPKAKARIEKDKQEASASQSKADEQKQKADYLANLRFNIDDIFGKNISEIK